MTVRRLELGSGYHPYATDNPEWLHADLNPNAPHVEYVVDIGRPLPFPDGTFAELRAVDCLEHLPYRRTATILAEWARVLLPGGRIYVQVPAADEMMRRYVHNPASMMVPEFVDRPLLVSVAWRIMGGQDDGERVRGADDFRLNAHYALFDEASIRWYFAGAGLHVDTLTMNPFPNYLVNGTKL